MHRPRLLPHISPNAPMGTRLALAFIVSMMAVGARADADEKAPQPKLVVGIVVDNLQEEYIDQLRQYFSRGGFNRLLNSSVVIPNVDYGSSLDPTAATAMLFTGSAPSVNGVPGARVFDRATMLTSDVFADRNYIGNYTEQTLSPAALLTSNITDEVRIAGDGATYAYAFAPDAAMSLAMGGHAANGAMWINDANGHWATTTYYTDLSRAFTTHNQSRPLSTRLDSVTWNPMMSSSRYMMLPRHLTEKPFGYTFSGSGPQGMQAFKNSPLVNTEVTDMAIAHINEMDLGSHDGPDMISIAYTLEPYAYSQGADNRYETVDAYYRLDHDIERLFQAIDSRNGLTNTLVFLATPPPSQRSRRDDRRWNIPYGEFSVRRAMSLLNLYFVSIYGQGNWVTGYLNNEFYLNHDLIKEKDLDLAAVRQQAAAFLAQMSGVGSAFTLDDIINRRTGALVAVQNVDLHTSGDVFIKVHPGWEIIDDQNNLQAKPDQVVREVAPFGSLYLMAPGLAPQTITTTVDARSVAPTVCGLLRIRSPNAASSAPLPL